MSVDTYRVVMGTCGWKHPEWLDSFYSEDLPQDWQLGFYSNEFPLVYVPSADWIEEPDLTEWIEDVNESFRFIFEVPAGYLLDDSLFEAMEEKIESIQDSCLGVVLMLTPNNSNDTTRLSKCIQSLQKLASVSVDLSSESISDEALGVLKEYRVSTVWNGESGAYNNSNQASLMICRINANDMDMPVLKEIVEACLQVSTEQCISVLCFEGNPPSIETLRNANMILDLL